MKKNIILLTILFLTACGTTTTTIKPQNKINLVTLNQVKQNFNQFVALNLKANETLNQNIQNSIEGDSSRLIDDTYFTAATNFGYTNFFGKTFYSYNTIPKTFFLQNQQNYPYNYGALLSFSFARGVPNTVVACSGQTDSIYTWNISNKNSLPLLTYEIGVPYDLLPLLGNMESIKAENNTGLTNQIISELNNNATNNSTFTPLFSHFFYTSGCTNASSLAIPFNTIQQSLKNGIIQTTVFQTTNFQGYIIKTTKGVIYLSAIQEVSSIKPVQSGYYFTHTTTAGPFETLLAPGSYSDMQTITTIQLATFVPNHGTSEIIGSYNGITSMTGTPIG